MADKMLSAEKVEAFIERESYRITNISGEELIVMDPIDFGNEIDSGQLDADCPKCGGVGHYPVRGEIAKWLENCDCPAGTGGSEK